MTNVIDENAGTGVRRRTVVRGAAWAVPAVVVATSAPAFAASPVPPGGLDGWVELQRRCGDGGRGPTQLTIDGAGNYPDRGLWVFVSPAGPTPSNATITFYLQSSGLTFSNSSGTGWSNLVRASGLDSTAPASGYYAYQTTYTGTWTYTDASGTATDRWVADTDPTFQTTYSTNCVTVRVYARRTVTTSLGTVSFVRGPVVLG